MEGVYRFAQQNIAVRSLHAAVHALCAPYRTDAAPDFTVETAQADIDFERARAAASDAALGRHVRAYADDYLESLAVYRAICERLPFYDTVLLHGSALCLDGEAYLFTAPSGTGKSTHARLWREVFGARVTMINDDKPLLRITDGGVTVYGTPYNGKHSLGADMAAPLGAICLLHRAEENVIRPIRAAEAFPTLLRQVYRCADAAAMARTLALLETLTHSVRLYSLGCNMDPAAARVAREGMKG